MLHLLDFVRLVPQGLLGRKKGDTVDDYFGTKVADPYRWLEDLDAGSVTIDGRDVTDAPPQKRGIGFVFQQFFLIDGLSAAMVTGAPFADHLSDRDHVAFLAFTRARALEHPKPQATLADVVRHCQHVRDVAGADHVGIGGDYDGTDTYPVGLEDVSGYPRLFEALAGRGWSDDDLVGLAGGNVLRVMRDVEAVALVLGARRGPSLATFEGLDGGD